MKLKCTRVESRRAQVLQVHQLPCRYWGGRLRTLLVESTGPRRRGLRERSEWGGHLPAECVGAGVEEEGRRLELVAVTVCVRVMWRANGESRQGCTN